MSIREGSHLIIPSVLPVAPRSLASFLETAVIFLLSLTRFLLANLGQGLRLKPGLRDHFCPVQELKPISEVTSRVWVAQLRLLSFTCSFNHFPDSFHFFCVFWGWKDVQLVCNNLCIQYHFPIDIEIGTSSSAQL